jgi:hypothetical protein
MTTADLCARFGVGQSTANAKARVISQALDTSRLNPEWLRNRGRFPGGRGSQNLKNVIQAAGDFAAA